MTQNQPIPVAQAGQGSGTTSSIVGNGPVRGNPPAPDVTAGGQADGATPGPNAPDTTAGGQAGDGPAPGPPDPDITASGQAGDAAAPGPHADATEALTAWRPAATGQESLRQAFLGYLAARPDACARACASGHLTASALVVDATGEQVLLTLHPRVGRWLQLGGHCEPEDETLVGAALREATEESGIPDLRIDPEPLHLDVHPVTCSLGIPTRHFDVRFLVHAPANATPVRSEESTDLRWWPTTALPADADDIADLVTLAQARIPTN